MNLAILQPPYPSSGTVESARDCLSWMVEAIRSLEPGGSDLVLLPEYANSPGLEARGVLRDFARGAGGDFLAFLAGESIRLKCLIAAGVAVERGALWLNGLALYDRGRRVEPVAEKQNLTEAEVERLGFSPGGLLRMLEVDGVRFGFAPCFDVYFPEGIEALAEAGVDLILSPSYQRSESPERIRLLAQARALDAGAWFCRSGYAMAGGRNGGESLVAGPDGSIVASAGGTEGVLRCEIEPQRKFVKPRSHGESTVEHRSLIQSRRRPACPRLVQQRLEKLRKVDGPRLCAHRGLSQVCPENTLPAFAAALALGVHEIEFDLWMSRDGVPVVCHDPRVDRTTDGQGVVSELDWADLRGMDAGIRLGPAWKGVGIPRFEEVIEQVAHRAMMNIHIKDGGPDGKLVRLVCDQIRRNGLMGHAYIAGHSEDVLAEALRYDPDIERASLVGQGHPESQQRFAERYRCRRIQFPRSVTAEQCRRAHNAGMTCNLFFADDPDEARLFVETGIDVVLTNCANLLFDSERFNRLRFYDERN